MDAIAWGSLGLELAASPAPGTIEVVTVRLDVAPEIVGELARCLSETEQRRARRIVHDRDRRRFIIRRAYLRHLLASRLGVRPDAVEWVAGPGGKPGLPRGPIDTDLRFNISRSEDIAVYAFTTGREIGIDVEAVREIPDADAIAARYFSRRENEEYRSLTQRDKAAGFFNCWTRKEAFIKAIGEGLLHPLDDFDVSLTPGEPARILRISQVPGDACGWTIHDFSPCPGFTGAVVAQESYVESELPAGHP